MNTYGGGCVCGEKLAGRVRRLLCRKPAFSERKMFGGLCFLLRGRMCCGVLGEELIVRVMPEEYAAALAQPHARVLDFTGRPLKGFVVVRPKGCAADQSLRDWVARGLRVVAALPAKTAKARGGVSRGRAAGACR